MMTRYSLPIASVSKPPMPRLGNDPMGAVHVPHTVIVSNVGILTWDDEELIIESEGDEDGEEGEEGSWRSPVAQRLVMYIRI